MKYDTGTMSDHAHRNEHDLKLLSLGILVESGKPILILAPCNHHDAVALDPAESAHRILVPSVNPLTGLQRI